MSDHPLELRHLRYAIAVAEDLSFTRAAARLRIAQPALSQQIRQLEERVGVRLFERRPRVAVTAAGLAFLGPARRALTDVLQASDAANRAHAGRPPLLRIGLASTAALTTIPTVIRSFAKAHPGVDLRLQEMHSAEQVEALRRGMLDVAVLREPILDPAIASMELVREPFVLALPRRHPLARRRLVEVSGCANEPFVLFPRHVAPTLHDQILALCREAGFRPRLENEAVEWHTIMALVAAGLGVTIGPASLGRLRVQGVTVRPLRTGAGRAVLFLCYDERAATSATRDFAAFACREAGHRASGPARRGSSQS